MSYTELFVRIGMVLLGVGIAVFVYLAPAKSEDDGGCLGPLLVLLAVALILTALSHFDLASLPR